MERKIVGRQEWLAAKKRSGRSKYNAQRVTIDGRTFDSRREAEVAQDFEFKRKAGLVASVEYQPVYELIPKPNRVTYRADFLITYPDGRIEVVDVKGMETDTFKIKAKMFRHFYPQLPLVILR